MVNTMKLVDSFKQEEFDLHIYYKKKPFCKANFDDFNSHKDMIETLSGEIDKEIKEEDLEIEVNITYGQDIYYLKNYLEFKENGRLIYSPEMFEYVKLTEEDKAKACFASLTRKGYYLMDNVSYGDCFFIGQFYSDEDMAECYFSDYCSREFPDFLWNAIDWEDVYRNCLSSRTSLVLDKYYFVDND